MEGGHGGIEYPSLVWTRREVLEQRLSQGLRQRAVTRLQTVFEFGEAQIQTSEHAGGGAKRTFSILPQRMGSLVLRGSHGLSRNVSLPCTDSCQAVPNLLLT